jgi:Tol biopolymer transport system component
MRYGRSGGAQIRVYDAGRSRRIASAAREFTHVHPVWSVRGQIAFSSHDVIYTMRPDGSHRRRVVAGEYPDWSPDGRWIVYQLPPALGTFAPVGGGGGIAMIRRDGRRRRMLTTDSAGDPAFSPDGKYIVFNRYDAATGRQGIAVMRLRDRRTRMIATAPPSSNPTPTSVVDHVLLEPNWQPLPRRRYR